MEIVSEGSLECISRPASTTSEKGRSAGSSRAAKKTIPLHTFGSMELLPPEACNLSGIPGELLSALERDVEVEDFEEEVDEDSNEDSAYSLSTEEYADEELDSTTDSADNEAPCADEKQELVNIPRRPGSDVRDANNHMGEEPLHLTEGNVDPQIREGLEKIKRLDKILADKLKKEKEVKNHRLMMEKMWKEQLQQMAMSPEAGSHGNYDLVGATLLALELGNEEKLGSSREDPVTPVFPTQPLNTDDTHTRYQASSATGSSTGRSSQRSNDSEESSYRTGRTHSSKRRSGSRQDSAKGSTNKKAHKTKYKHKGHDFIKRNKELAADAANVIPMTDEEKSRLDSLLKDDINEMMENPYDEASRSLTSGIGFIPDQQSARALADIDEKLQALVPADELELLSSRALTDRPLSQSLTDTTSVHSQASESTSGNLDNIGIGERILREEKDMREVHQRLLSIERELEKLKQVSDGETENTLSRDLLAKLLGESSRTTSRSTTIGQAVLTALSTPRQFAIEQGLMGSVGATPSTLGTLSSMSDVTPTSEEADTPRTITSAYSTYS